MPFHHDIMTLHLFKIFGAIKLDKIFQLDIEFFLVMTKT